VQRNGSADLPWRRTETRGTLEIRLNCNRFWSGQLGLQWRLWLPQFCTDTNRHTDTSVLTGIQTQAYTRSLRERLIVGKRRRKESKEKKWGAVSTSMSLIVVQWHFLRILKAFEKYVPFHVENEKLQVQQKYAVSAQKANVFIETEYQPAKVILRVLWSYVLHTAYLMYCGVTCCVLTCTVELRTAYLLTPWSSRSWEANRFPTIQEISAFYGTRRFITAFTSACHLSISRASSIQSIPYIPLPEDTFYYYSPIDAWVTPLISFCTVELRL
jgi:hypothetical protein